MPAAMHSQYLRSCYLQNALVKPGAFTILGTPVDLSKIRTPLYVLGAETDHIAPWRATYRMTQLTSGEATYTLTSSGHVAGIVNPPGNPKSKYWTSGVVPKGTSAENWRASATATTGSWWEHWLAWAERRSGALVSPPKLPNGDAAPGLYVRGETGPLTEAVRAKRPAALSAVGKSSKPNAARVAGRSAKPAARAAKNGKAATSRRTKR
jgi:polyhydroxyalkanoate synthase subunit PhaC